MRKKYRIPLFAVIYICFSILLLLLIIKSNKNRVTSFYQKLADCRDVSILIIGDSIGNGSGASDEDHKWTSLLSKWLKEEYGVEVRMTNVSMNGNSSYAGYVRTLTLEEDDDYDLAILCYGQNDPTLNFRIYYEALVRAVRRRFPSSAVISILESSQKIYTEKILTIEKIAKWYNIPVADTIAPFMDNYDNLVVDGVHPNDNGQYIYASILEDIIQNLVKKRAIVEKQAVKCLDDKVEYFDTFEWHGIEEFHRDGNSFSLSIKTDAMILGIDYLFTDGDNDFSVMIDGLELDKPEYPFRLRHIEVVNSRNDERMHIQREIKVACKEDDVGTLQADGFRGIALSGLKKGEQ